MSSKPIVPRTLALLLIACLLGNAVASEENSRRGRGTTGNWLRRLQRLRPSTNERNHPRVREAFRKVVSDARLSTVRVLCNGLQVSLGTIVHASGYVLTKESELYGEIECLVADGRRLNARVVAREPDYDLALLRLPEAQLAPVNWSDDTLVVGAWLATPGLGIDAKAVGVMSAPPRRIPSRAALGVQLEAARFGPRILKVIPESGAAEAGLRPGDTILKVKGKPVISPSAVTKEVSRNRPGDKLQLEVRRGNSTMLVEAVLGDLSRLVNEQAEIMENLAGPLSDRRTGFPLAIQHDTVLRPRDCGGPLVDLTGRVVGINIARASRVASYALPAQTIQSMLPAMLAKDVEAAQTVNAAAGGTED